MLDIHVDEWKAQPLGGKRPQGGLANAGHTDKDYIPASCFWRSRHLRIPVQSFAERECWDSECTQLSSMGEPVYRHGAACDYKSRRRLSATAVTLQGLGAHKLSELGNAMVRPASSQTS